MGGASTSGWGCSACGSSGWGPSGGRGLLCTAPCSTVGNIEGQWAMKTGNVTSLSAELLVDCDDSKDPQQ